MMHAVILSNIGINEYCKSVTTYPIELLQLASTTDSFGVLPNLVIISCARF